MNPVGVDTRAAGVMGAPAATVEASTLPAAVFEVEVAAVGVAAGAGLVAAPVVEAMGAGVEETEVTSALRRLAVVEG